jgi:hypothetical protein
MTIGASVKVWTLRRVVDLSGVVLFRAGLVVFAATLELLLTSVAKLPQPGFCLPLVPDKGFATTLPSTVATHRRLRIIAMAL